MHVCLLHAHLLLRLLQIVTLLLALAREAGMGCVHLVRRDTVQTLLEGYLGLDTPVLTGILQSFEALTANPALLQPLQVSSRVQCTCGIGLTIQLFRAKASAVPDMFCFACRMLASSQRFNPAWTASSPSACAFQHCAAWMLSAS